MGIRESLNKNPAITTGATIAVILIALGAIVWQLWPSSKIGIPTKCYYTIDDGASWFVDSSNLIAPFDKDGKQAYRAYVFTCDGGKTKFIAYLERYTDKAKKAMEEMKTKQKADPNLPPDYSVLQNVMDGGMEVKKPNEPKGRWVSQADYMEYSKVVDFKCPGDGKRENLEIVMP